MSSRAYIREFAESFERKDFGAAILKWAPLIETTVRNAARLMRHDDEEDMLQALLLDLASFYDYFVSPLYRYNGIVWKVKEQQGRLVLLVSPESRLAPLTPCWTYASYLEPVKKSSASSFVYRRIVQFVPDLATKKFRKRNGFKLQAQQRAVVEKSGKKNELRLRTISCPVQQHPRVHTDHLEDCADTRSSTDLVCAARRALSNASLPAKLVAQALMAGAKSDARGLGRQLGLKMRQVSQAKLELYRGLKNMEYPKGCSPVYFTAGHMR